MCSEDRQRVWREQDEQSRETRLRKQDGITGILERTKRRGRPEFTRVGVLVEIGLLVPGVIALVLLKLIRLVETQPDRFLNRPKGGL